MAITREQVFKVADELIDQAIRPTLAKVRSALGGGSVCRPSAQCVECVSLFCRHHFLDAIFLL